MIVSSLLILAVAAALLTIGLVTGNNQLLTWSIATSLAAATVLYLCIRRQEPRPGIDEGRADDDTRELTRIGIDDTQELRRIGLEEPPTTEIPIVAARVFEPTDYSVDRDPELRFEVPPPRGGAHAAEPSRPQLGEEPPEQRLSSVEAAALMRLDAEVAVVDGRPRFHHESCVHLVGREPEPVSVAEAIELGFSPCSLCEPASRLLMAPMAGR